MAKILLVEDDTNLSEIYQARLEAEGYVVVAASEGETALALAAKEKPDLILSDVMMPKISGFEMLDILRNTEGFKQTKVIMLTALGQAEDKTRAEALGADRYLVKSQVTLEDIVTAAHELLNNDALPIAPVTMTPTPAVAAIPPAIAVAPTPVQAAPTGPLEPTLQPTTSPSIGMTTPSADTTIAPPTPDLANTGQFPQMAVSEPPTTTATIPTAAPPTPSADNFALTEPVITPAPADPIMVVPPPIPAAPNAIVSEEIAAPAPAPSLETATSPAEPLSQPAPDTSAITGPIDESVVANAIDKLLAKTPGGIPGDNTSTPPSTIINPTTPADRFHKKVVSPPEHVAAPSLQELLAKEEAKTAGVSGIASAAQTVPQPVAPQPFDPNSVAL